MVLDALSFVTRCLLRQPSAGCGALIASSGSWYVLGYVGTVRQPFRRCCCFVASTGVTGQPSERCK